MGGNSGGPQERKKMGKKSSAENTAAGNRDIEKNKVSGNIKVSPGNKETEEYRNQGGCKKWRKEHETKNMPCEGKSSRRASTSPEKEGLS